MNIISIVIYKPFGVKILVHLDSRLKISGPAENRTRISSMPWMHSTIILQAPHISPRTAVINFIPAEGAKPLLQFLK